MLDDDPTGSQAVHGVTAVLTLDPEEYLAGLADPGATCFVLTNTRSLVEPDAATLTRRVGRDLFRVADRLGAPLEIVSRSDSTLRGHLVAEVGALDAARREIVGRGFDGVLFVPAFIEAGRFTAGDRHHAVVEGRPMPVGHTEFARDPTFGYRSSDLRDHLVERSGGQIARDDVLSLSLDVIRRGGPDRVAQMLAEVRGGRFVVVNATGYADLEVVVLGLLTAQRTGRTFLHRTGPSFVRALAGLEPRGPLTGDEIAAPPGRHGLVAVGSHVGLTNRQLAALRAQSDLVDVALDAAAVLDPASTADHIAEAAAQIRTGLATADVLLVTGRDVLQSGPEGALAASRTVSLAVADVVGACLSARPGWIVAKGGITSHDIAVRGLGIRRAVVLGQLFPGLVSVLRPIDATPEAIGMPYVVFAGNVGGPRALVDVVTRLQPAPDRADQGL